MSYIQKDLERSVLTRDSPFLKKLHKRECGEEKLLLKTNKACNVLLQVAAGELGGLFQVSCSEV